MSEHEVESFASELRRLRPARASEPFVNRLQQAARRASSTVSRARAPSASQAPGSIWTTWGRWLMPVAGAAVILGVLLVTRKGPDHAARNAAVNTEAQVIDEVELDQHLVAAFEGVAKLPGSPPLRFRCYGWQEELTLRDASGAIEVEQRGPRLEVVPVGFDVY